MFNNRDQNLDIRVSDANQPIQLSIANLNNNIKWGDELNEKLDDTTRIYVLNVHGLSLDRRGGHFDDLCKVSKEVQADVLCGQEINVDVSQPMVRSILYHTSRQHWKRSRLILGNTPTPFTTRYKPGGTMTLSTGNVTGRVVASESDRWGRWASQTFQGLNQMKLTIILANQVEPDVPDKGAITAAAQQRNLLMLANDPLSDPRAAFKRDLSQFLQERRSQGKEIILVGDSMKN